ncbi:ATP-binding protein [Enterocloster clostridioformis]|uniref:ATPase n=1 Tax=Enterocloster clostridioformis TaxID=1531 RepID=A0A174USY4_9FIRM|nr:ATP-binding protein [Enterocloster clostridioformis]MDB2128728.1 ATP-binding protein [Enterocloster clostridioformis]CUQ23147.1 ATPase [Enterocloster clostridioformis]
MGMTANQLSLVRYVAENNLSKMKQAAIACCAEDTTQKNKWAVGKYKSILMSGGMNLIELPANISAFATMEDLSLTYIGNRYYLTSDEERLFELIKKMNDVSLQLMEKQIPYLNATLLYGESGVGKTEFSKYVAYKLGLPYLYVNFSRMLDSYLGGTAKNLTYLFNYINQQQCVVMLDEIDSLAVKREYGSGSASAEVSRSTTCLLQLLDSVSNDHVILAATNLVEDVDNAVKRRFTQKHELHKLSSEDNERFIVQYLEDTGFEYDMDSVKDYAKSNVTQAEIMTHITRAIASMLIEESSQVILEREV